MKRRVVAVIGASECNEEEARQAEEVGRLLAERGYTVATGGLSGVMEAASRGAHEAGGTVLGILPSPDAAEANDFVDISIPTGMGEARNVVLVNTAFAAVAVAKGLGTLAEIAFLLRAGRTVVSLGSWVPTEEVIQVDSPEDAVERIAASDSLPPHPPGSPSG